MWVVALIAKTTKSVVSLKNDKNKGIVTIHHCHISIFDQRFYIHTVSDLEYSLTFQRKIRQRGTLKYLIFYSISGPFFIIFYFYFYL